MSAIAALLAACVACKAPVPGAQGAPADASAPAEASFAAPPHIQSVRRLTGGRLLLAGVAASEAAVRLAAPGGAAYAAIADAKGQWSVTVPALAEPALFGLSARDGRRTVQAKGYVLLLPLLAPSPVGALLQAGAGAAVLGGAGPGTYIEAIDLDAGRAAIVSGVADPGRLLAVSVDGVVAGDGVAGPARRFSVPLGRAIDLGPRRIAVTGEGAAAVSLVLGAPAAPTPPPLHALRLDGAWRIDWVTPGGGLQTTYLIDRPGAGA